jgi:purine nucleoside permease
MSEKTGIDFHEGSINVTRYANQQVIAHSLDDKVIFGGKPFVDIINIYNRMPTVKPPVCFSETMVFRMNGDVNACCIDYRNMTVFANIIDASVKDVFKQYVSIINAMRTQGSPFECCYNCLGYNTYREKLAKWIYSLTK